METPHFDSQTQQTYAPGERIFRPGDGTEGTYVGHDRDSAKAIVKWDWRATRMVASRAEYGDIEPLYR